MKILIVGCGAVGQVYGLALQKAGVTLGLLDQPAMVEKLNQAHKQDGLLLFQVTFTHRKDPIVHRLVDYQVIADAAESRQFAPDQIWFTTPSQVYYSDWFRDFVRQVPSKRVVCFVPEGRRVEFFNDGDVIPDRVIFGGTTFMAWQSDLEAGAGRSDGINFWRSPLGIPLAGSQDACREVGQLLKQAGFGVMGGKSDSRSQACVTAVMTAFTAGLELSGWSLGGYRKSPWRRCAASACREAVLSQLPRAGVFMRAVLSSPTLSVCFFLAALFLPLLFPFDLEKYLKFHYTKTHEQTVLLLNLFMKDAARRGFPITNVQSLLKGLLDASK